MLKAVLFDWGDTIMVDFPDQKGPMHSWDRVRLVPNADACIMELSKKFPLYLATNAKDSSKSDIRKALSLVKIDKYFDDIFCFQEIQAAKPSSFFFQYIFKNLGLRANEAVHIGDDIEKDYQGAKKYGLNAILYDPRGEHPEISDKVADLADVPLFIKSQNNYCL